jgi:hypothetical protein
LSCNCNNKFLYYYCQYRNSKFPIRLFIVDTEASTLSFIDGRNTQASASKHKQHRFSNASAPLTEAGPDGQHSYMPVPPSPVPSINLSEKNMNARQLIAGLAILAAAGSALADAPYPPETPFVSTKSRADVQAEVAQAQKDGTLNQARSEYPTVAAASKPVTRAEVVSQISNTEPSVYSGN